MTTVAYATRDVNGCYQVGALVLPSITTLLRPYKGLRDWELHPKFCERGSIVHAAAEQFIGGTITGTTYLDDWVEAEIEAGDYEHVKLHECYPYVRSLVCWFARHFVRVDVGGRVEVGGWGAGYAGKPDGTRIVIAEDKSRGDVYPYRLIPDYKTQGNKTPKAWHLLQGAGLMNLVGVAYADGRFEQYGESEQFANLCVTPDGSFLRPWSQHDVRDAYNECFAQIVRIYWGERTCDWFAIEDAVRRRDAWFARYKRKEVRAEFWPLPAPVLRAPRSKSARRSAADVRAARNAKAFFSEVNHAGSI